MWKYALCTLFFLLHILSSQAFAVTKKKANNSDDDPCGGDNALFSLLNRPSILDSACTVKARKFLLEMGYQYTYLSGGKYGDNFPQASLRIGLPDYTEFDFLPPNYIHYKPSGFSPMAIALKHELAYSKKWVFAIEGYLIPPTGSAAQGSTGLGGIFNILFAYNLTSTIGIDLGLGISSATVSEQSGGRRYTSVNPDILLTWQPQSKLQLFAEIYAQTRTSPSDGFGSLVDAGMQYLITPCFEIDAEAGTRIYGNIGSFNYYAGVGLGVLIT